MAKVNPMEIIGRHYRVSSRVHDILVSHSRAVTDKALEIARGLGDAHIDLDFISEAAMLHDIGILGTRARSLGCTGDLPYLAHGHLGRQILEGEGLPRHALVCERHIGMGITAQEIASKGLPLPGRDIVPVSIEEQIICFADAFFSKGDEDLFAEKQLHEIRDKVRHWGARSLETFDHFVHKFV